MSVFSYMFFITVIRVRCPFYCSYHWCSLFVFYRRIPSFPAPLPRVVWGVTVSCCGPFPHSDSPPCHAVCSHHIHQHRQRSTHCRTQVPQNIHLRSTSSRLSGRCGCWWRKGRLRKAVWFLSGEGDSLRWPVLPCGDSSPPLPRKCQKLRWHGRPQQTQDTGQGANYSAMSLNG